MILISRGFTPREIDEEFSWTDIERFLAVLPAIERFAFLQE